MRVSQALAAFKARQKGEVLLAPEKLNLFPDNPFHAANDGWGAVVNEGDFHGLNSPEPNIAGGWRGFSELATLRAGGAVFCAVFRARVAQR